MVGEYAKKGKVNKLNFVQMVQKYKCKILF